jgi:nicotinamidase-related amidase
MVEARTDCFTVRCHPGRFISVFACRSSLRLVLWVTPWMQRVLPVVVKLCEAFSERTIFTRFIPPETAEAEIGVWRRFYSRWHDATLQCLDPSLLGLVDELARFVPPAVVVDKGRFSAFAAPAWPRYSTRAGQTR